MMTGRVETKHRDGKGSGEEFSFQVSGQESPSPDGHFSSDPDAQERILLSSRGARQRTSGVKALGNDPGSFGKPKKAG